MPTLKEENLMVWKKFFVGFLFAQALSLLHSDAKIKKAVQTENWTHFLGFE